VIELLQDEIETLELATLRAYVPTLNAIPPSLRC